MLAFNETGAHASGRFAALESHHKWTWELILGTVCLGWYVFILLICAIGYVQLQRNYSSVPSPPVSITLPPSRVPHVTILRPIKGVEPSLYECLAATFRQNYPRNKLTIYFCISSRDEPALPILHRLVEDFSTYDAKIFVQDEDPNLHEPHGVETRLGPNPKIRNMSRGYREAKGDIIWIIDCNVWVGKGVAGRMVDLLCGYTNHGQRRKSKFVHQLPMVVDTIGAPESEAVRGLFQNEDGDELHAASTSTASYDVRTHWRRQTPSSVLNMGGGRLEELFMSSSHAKFYTAINTILVAPCIVGKSNMFRRSHLNSLTSSNPDRVPGIDFFSDNICEDHLIGDLLWKHKTPEEEAGGKLGRHALLFGDLAIQPMAGMSVKEYIARRVRWLRVRKFTVTLATLVEPGTESFLCSCFGAYAITTLPWFHQVMGIPQTWTVFVLLWLLSVMLWILVDWTVYRKLRSAATIELDENTPAFARPPKYESQRPFVQWLFAWLGRETLAFPVWLWAVFGGVTVVWRGKKFWVGMDMRVHEVVQQNPVAPRHSGHSLVENTKSRRD
ncbi:MAG: hypothetical protein M1827_000219 [Pycnora praestabilis]|nr:MAG: hypothetical protein M1827_000219 [Pycnora praestabilis]